MKTLGHEKRRWNTPLTRCKFFFKNSTFALLIWIEYPTLKDIYIFSTLDATLIRTS
jgi:hypothetical protein